MMRSATRPIKAGPIKAGPIKAGIAGLLTAVAALAAIAGGAAATEHLPPPDPTLGHELAQRVCSGCHLVDEQQRGPVVDGVPTFMGIADRLDDAAIETILLSPSHPVMPNAPLTAAERRDVVAHIRNLAAD